MGISKAQKEGRFEDPAVEHLLEEDEHALRSFNNGPRINTRAWLLHLVLLTINLVAAIYLLSTASDAFKARGPDNCKLRKHELGTVNR